MRKIALTALLALVVAGTFSMSADAGPWRGRRGGFYYGGYYGAPVYTGYYAPSYSYAPAYSTYNYDTPVYTQPSYTSNYPADYSNGYYSSSTPAYSSYYYEPGYSYGPHAYIGYGWGGGWRGGRGGWRR